VFSALCAAVIAFLTFNQTLKGDLPVGIPIPTTSVMKY
jgi:hypothetical protein